MHGLEDLEATTVQFFADTTFPVPTAIRNVINLSQITFQLFASWIPYGFRAKLALLCSTQARSPRKKEDI